MANPNKSNSWEQQLYDETVKEAVEEVARIDKGDVNSIDNAIQSFIQKVNFNDKQKAKFQGEVMRRVAERKRQTDDAHEREILTGLEGKVISVKKGSGVEKKLVGTHESEKFYARGGSLFRRIFGHRYNAQEVSEKLEGIQELENRIQKNQEQIDMITAARDASKSARKVARQIFKQKREGRFLVGYIDDKVASWKAALEQKKHAKTRYKTEMKGLTKLQESSRKVLLKEKKAVSAVMEKVDARREKTREIFDKNFGAQVEHLLQLTGTRREDEEKELREQIRKFGKNAKIVYLEYYLNEALGLEPKVLFDEQGNEDKTPYREPLNERERLQELIDMKKWCQFMGGKKVSDSQVQQVLNYFKGEKPRAIVDMRKANLQSPTPAMMVMRFMLSGVDTKGKKLLKKRQLAEFTPATVYSIYLIGQEHGSSSDLQKKMEAFASLGKKYKSEDFDYVFDTLGTPSQPKAKLKKKAKKQSSTASQPTQGQANFGPTPAANPTLVSLTDKERHFAEMFGLGNMPNEARELYHRIEQKNPQFESQLKSPENCKILKFFFQCESKRM